jgi:penicillin-binding protein 2
LLKRIAILAVAMVLLGKTRTFPGAAPPPGQQVKTSAYRVSLGPPERSSKSRQAVSGRTGSTRRRRVHRRRRWRNPWRVSSFADPGADDNLAGEDPLVRQAAIEALGNWNGSVVVVDPNTGRVLSVVNQKIAFGSAFNPCSTFKPVVALAALKEGIITPETELRVGRRTQINLTEALAHSNNPFFTRLGQMIGFRRLAQYAHEFGLGEKTGETIPGEVAGRFPAKPPKRVGVGILSSYGVEIEVTPLQMAAVASTIANGGTFYEIQYPRTPEDVGRFKPKVRRQLDDLAPFIPEIKDGLAAAVVYGTARSAYSPDEQIFGKTGTCSEEGARLGWFVSYSSEQQPKYVVVVLLRGGRLMYGPHAAEIAGRLYQGLRQRESVAGARAEGSSLLPALVDNSH